MSSQSLTKTAGCVAVLVLSAGCPGGPNVVGWWAVELSPGDTHSLLLYTDGSAGYVAPFDSFEGGAWSTTGNAVTISFVLPTDNFQKTFEGTASGSTMTGTWVQGAPNIASGTFEATKIVP